VLVLVLTPLSPPTPTPTPTPQVRKKDHKEFALKFFGYTDNAPLPAEIDEELGLMQALNHLHGVLHLQGVFRDTGPGLVASAFQPKHTQEPFKVTS
jgi:hypothetical protein